MRRYVAPYLIAIDGMQLIQTAGLLITGQENGAQGVSENRDPAGLASRLEEWFYQYKRLWRTVSREGELARVQGVINWTADQLRTMKR